MTDSLVAVLLAFVGYTLLNLGQAGQKIGLGMRAERPVAGWTLWVGATLATSVSFGLVFVAISRGAVSLVGAMAGTGLVSLALFGRFVMKEELRPRHIAALAGIVGGAAVIALLDVPDEGATDQSLLYGLLGGGTVAYVAVWAFIRRGPIAGALLGGLAGFLGAYSQLFQELSTASLPWDDGVGAVVATVVTSPITAIWVGLSLVSMVIAQFSYKHGDATQIIPVFTGNFIIVPVVGGVIVFGETLGPFQWVGVIAILAGSIVLGRKRASLTQESLDRAVHD